MVFFCRNWPQIFVIFPWKILRFEVENTEIGIKLINLMMIELESLSLLSNLLMIVNWILVVDTIFLMFQFFLFLANYCVSITWNFVYFFLDKYSDNRTSRLMNQVIANFRSDKY